MTQWNGHNHITSPKTVEGLKKIIDHIFDPKAAGIESIMKKYLFVVEADEYNRHFLHLDPDYAIITNIELDHADIYGDEATYFEAFHRFARKVKRKIWMLDGAKGVEQIKEHPQLSIITKQTFPFTHLLGAHNHGNASLALECVAELLTKGHHPDDGTAHAVARQSLIDFQ